MRDADMDVPAHAISVGSLARAVDPVTPDTRCEEARAAFASDPSLYAIPVVDASRNPVGLLNRFKFIERMSSRFGRALTDMKSVGMVMERSPLILDESAPIDRVGDLFIAEDNPYVFDGFIVTREGRYVAVGTGFDLMRALTERRHAELFHLAEHDSLTRLPNRYQFDRRLKQALDAARETRTRVALLFVDLDRFKGVNDTFGHHVGDLVLSATAQRLRANLRRSDIIARLSGDEFAIVLTDIGSEDAADVVATSVVTTCSTPLHIENQEIVISCSVGVAMFPDDAQSGVTLAQAADAAVYHAKHVRNTYQRYTPEMTRTPDWHFLTFSALRQAIDLTQLTLHYQPKFELATGRVCGVEALVRWEHPQHGMVEPGDLVRLAEDSGLIVAVSEYVLRTAMRDVLEWTPKIDAAGFRVAVNISSVHLRQGGLVSLLDQLTSETGCAASRIELELTESAAMGTGRSTEATLRALKQRGFVLAIDDFGTGYSSLSRLERLPVDVLKIDQSFVAGIGQPGRNGAIVKAIAALGHSLGLQVVGEGVETDAQLAFLRDQACDVAQGFLLARPAPAANILRYLVAPPERG
jgi:diguanylate cyclase (GGDEF)-like protein